MHSVNLFYARASTTDQTKALVDHAFTLMQIYGQAVKTSGANPRVTFVLLCDNLSCTSGQLKSLYTILDQVAGSELTDVKILTSDINRCFRSPHHMAPYLRGNLIVNDIGSLSAGSTPDADRNGCYSSLIREIDSTFTAGKQIKAAMSEQSNIAMHSRPISEAIIFKQSTKTQGNLGDAEPEAGKDDSNTKRVQKAEDDFTDSGSESDDDFIFQRMRDRFKMPYISNFNCLLGSSSSGISITDCREFTDPTLCVGKVDVCIPDTAYRIFMKITPRQKLHRKVESSKFWNGAYTLFEDHIAQEVPFYIDVTFADLKLGSFKNQDGAVKYMVYFDARIPILCRHNDSVRSAFVDMCFGFSITRSDFVALLNKYKDASIESFWEFNESGNPTYWDTHLEFLGKLKSLVYFAPSSKNIHVGKTEIWRSKIITRINSCPNEFMDQYFPCSFYDAESGFISDTYKIPTKPSTNLLPNYSSVFGGTGTTYRNRLDAYDTAVYCLAEKNVAATKFFSYDTVIFGGCTNIYMSYWWQVQRGSLALLLRFIDSDIDYESHVKDPSSEEHTFKADKSSVPLSNFSFPVGFTANILKMKKCQNDPNRQHLFKQPRIISTMNAKIVGMDNGPLITTIDYLNEIELEPVLRQPPDFITWVKQRVQEFGVAVIDFEFKPADAKDWEKIKELPIGYRDNQLVFINATNMSESSPIPTDYLYRKYSLSKTLKSSSDIRAVPWANQHLKMNNGKVTLGLKFRGAQEAPTAQWTSIHNIALCYNNEIPTVVSPDGITSFPSKDYTFVDIVIEDSNFSTQDRDREEEVLDTGVNEAELKSDDAELNRLAESMFIGKEINISDLDNAMADVHVTDQEDLPGGARPKGPSPKNSKTPKKEPKNLPASNKKFDRDRPKILIFMYIFGLLKVNTDCITPESNSTLEGKIADAANIEELTQRIATLCSTDDIENVVQAYFSMEKRFFDSIIPIIEAQQRARLEGTISKDLSEWINKYITGNAIASFFSLARSTAVSDVESLTKEMEKSMDDTIKYLYNTVMKFENYPGATYLISDIINRLIMLCAELSEYSLTLAARHPFLTSGATAASLCSEIGTVSDMFPEAIDELRNKQSFENYAKAFGTSPVVRTGSLKLPNFTIQSIRATLLRPKSDEKNSWYSEFPYCFCHAFGNIAHGHSVQY